MKDLDEPLKDKDVIIVEDIVDSGRTLSYLMEMMRDRGPRSLKLCTLLDKPERRVVDVKVDYTGFRSPTSSWWDMVWTMTRDTATFPTSAWWNLTAEALTVQKPLSAAKQED